MLLLLLKELIDIILSSSDPQEALQRAKTAAETVAMNTAVDETLKRL